jgi:hypothetical protein
VADRWKGMVLGTESDRFYGLNPAKELVFLLDFLASLWLSHLSSPGVTRESPNNPAGR